VPEGKLLMTVQRVIGRGFKQTLIEETKTIPDAVKIVEIVPSLRNLRFIVRHGKVIVQGVLHKQIFFIATDGLEHHLAEDIDFNELVDIIPVDPERPAAPGMNVQDHSVVENVVFEFDEATGQLIQKVIIAIDLVVTETEDLNVLLDPLGPVIKTPVKIGEGEKQKFIRDEIHIPGAIKITDIVTHLRNVRVILKNGKAIVQGILHKQIFFVATDSIVHHVQEEINWSELVEIEPVNPDVPARPGMTASFTGFVENLVFELDPATGVLVQKVIILVRVVVTETQQVPVALDPYGIPIKTELVIGHGDKQRLIETTIPLPDAIKIVDIQAFIRDVTSVVKEGKVIVQGRLHKQIFFVGTDGLVHHITEDIDFSEMVEIDPLDPDVPARSGMNQQDHSFVESLAFEFDPHTGELTQKVVIRIQVKVTQTQELTVADP